MKIAVSIPDDLFRLAETAAGRLGVSRDQLYANAIAAEFLSRQEADSITEQLNDVYADVATKVDPALHRGQLVSPDEGCW